MRVVIHPSQREAFAKRHSCFKEQWQTVLLRAKLAFS